MRAAACCNCAGQAGCATPVALGSAVASAAEGVSKMARAVKKASNGTITATLFPSEQLGKAFDHYDMARDGIADLDLHQSRLPARPFPDHGGRPRCPSCSPTARAARRARRLVPPVRGQGDEGRKFCFAFVHDPATFQRARRSCCPPTSRA